MLRTVAVVAALAGALLIGGVAADTADAASRAADKSRIVRQQQAIVTRNREITRLRNVNRGLRTQGRAMQALIDDAWTAAGRPYPDLRGSGTLAARVAEMAAETVTVRTTLEAALTAGVVNQIAGYPSGADFRSLIVALCNRARAGGVGYRCSVYSSTGYVSWDFDNL